MASLKGHSIFRNPITGETAIMTKAEAELKGYCGVMKGRNNAGAAARQMKPVEVSSPDGQTQVFPSIQDASQALNVHPNVISRRLREGGSPISGPAKGFTFRVLSMV